MKKISVKSFNLKGVEQLSREQLKGVVGGGRIDVLEAKQNCYVGCHSDNGLVGETSFVGDSCPTAAPSCPSGLRAQCSCS